MKFQEYRQRVRPGRPTLSMEITIPGVKSEDQGNNLIHTGWCSLALKSPDNGTFCISPLPLPLKDPWSRPKEGEVSQLMQGNPWDLWRRRASNTGGYLPRPGVNPLPTWGRGTPLETQATEPQGPVALATTCFPRADAATSTPFRDPPPKFRSDPAGPVPSPRRPIP